MCLPPTPEAKGFPATRPPTSPPFTVGQLRRAIPAHCFERSLLRSSSYLIVDLVAIAALYYASTFIDSAPAWLAWGLLWPLYWWAGRRHMDSWGLTGSTSAMTTVLGFQRHCCFPDSFRSMYFIVTGSGRALSPRASG